VWVDGREGRAVGDGDVEPGDEYVT
jgi:hypothetical protein